MRQCNEENMRTFIAALRSGEYGQGQRRLKSAEGYCCLGVACEVSGLGDWEGDIRDSHGQVYVIDENDFSRTVLPMGVSRWLGIDQENHGSQNPYIVEAEDGDISAATMNDLLKKSFAEIADAFETYYLTDVPAVV